MADIEYAPGMGAEDGAEGLSWRGIVNGLGAAASLALVVGLGWWGYQTLKRDVTGVPVIRALEGPMRVAPDDPGGSSAEYQGLAVNSIPAKGAADAPADRLVLAPGPTELRAEDRPAAELEALARQQKEAAAASRGDAPAMANAPGAAGTVPAADGPAQTGGQGQTAPSEPANAQTANTTADAAQGPAGHAAAQAAPDAAGSPNAAGSDAAQPDAAPAAAEPAADIASVIEQTLREVTGADKSQGAGSHLVRVRRPVLRPASLGAAASASAARPERPVVNRLSPAANSASDGTAARTVPAPVKLPAGTIIAHVGSFQSSADAQAAWERIAPIVKPVMGPGRSHVILRRNAISGVVYRLSISGFSSRSEVTRFCAALEGQIPICIPFETE